MHQYSFNILALLSNMKSFTAQGTSCKRVSTMAQAPRRYSCGIQCCCKFIFNLKLNQVYKSDSLNRLTDGLLQHLCTVLIFKPG